MPNRQKDEKIERAIRMVSKLQENRRCVNCNSLGPQYVCITFWTFVCTSCCAIHREFSHRVKSISMTKFSSDDVGALETGGNQRAREIYMKELDLQCNPFPDNSNPYRLRAFIKHVYIDRKYTGAKSMDTISRLKAGHLHMKDSGYHSGLVSSHTSGKNGRPDGDKILRSFSNDRNDCFSEEGGRYSSQKRSPARFEVVDDRVKDGESGSCRKWTTTGLVGSKGKTKPSMEHPNLNIGSMDHKSFHIDKTMGQKTSDTEAQLRKNTSCNDSCHVNGGEISQEKVESEYLIDFNTNTESSEQTQHDYVGGGDCPYTSGDHDHVTRNSKSAILDSLLSELAMPNLSSIGSTAAVSDNLDILSCMGDLPVQSGHDLMPKVTNGKEFEMATFENVTSLPSNGYNVSSASQVQHVSSCNTPCTVANSECSEYMPQNSKHTDTGSKGGASSGSIFPLYDQKHSASVHDQHTQSSFKQNQSMDSGVGSFPSTTAEASFCGRKELPVDLFTTVYLPLPQVPWRSVQAPGLLYDTKVVGSSHSSSYNSARTKNPFDFNLELAQVQNQTLLTARPSSSLHISHNSASPPRLQPFPSQVVGQKMFGNDVSCLPVPPGEEDSVRRNPFEYNVD